MSCSAVPTPAPSPASLPTDPELAVQVLDPEKYPEFDDHVVVSSGAMRQYLTKLAKERKAARDAKINHDADMQVLNEASARVEAKLAQREWWAENGWKVGVAATLASEGAIAVIVWMLVSLLPQKQ